VSVLAGERWHHYPAGKGPAGQRVWDIAECPIDGDVWITHDLGLSRYAHDPGTWKHFTRAQGFPTWHVRCVAFDADGTLIVGTQTDGLLVAKREGTDYPKFESIEGAEHLTMRATGDGLPKWPREDSRDAKVALRDELTWARAKLDRMPAKEPAVMGLPDDWQTQGDWIGAYGRHFGVLCAGQSPNSIRVGDFSPRVRYAPMLGPHRKNFVQEPDKKRHVYRYVRPDSVRYWVWDKFTDDRRALQLPPGYVKEWIEKEMPESDNVRDKPAWHRRPAGIVDNAQDYSLMFDGPHLQIALDVPDGVFQVSLYLLNYDGNHEANRARDHRLRVYHHTARHLADIGDTERLPLLYQGRGVEFFGGVYKRMLVRGPVKLAIQVNRNHSYNTMLSGIFVDTWSGPDGPTTPPDEASLEYQIKK